MYGVHTYLHQSFPLKMQRIKSYPVGGLEMRMLERERHSADANLL